MEEQHDKAQYNWTEMSEDDLGSLLKGSLVTFHTGAMEKFRKYRMAFTLLEGKNGPNTAGVNLHLCHSSEVNIVPSKTEEKKGTTKDNGLEKAYAQMVELSDNITNIRNSFPENYKDKWQTLDLRKGNIVGVTEDSGVRFFLGEEKNRHIEDLKRTKQFNEAIIAAIADKLPADSRDKMIAQIRDKGFPSAELKPVQEILGGFDALMQVVYNAAETVDAKEIRYENQSALTFVDPVEKRYFQKEIFSFGTLMDAREYTSRTRSVTDGKAIDTDFVMIPDAQAEGVSKTLSEIDSDIYTKSSDTLSADFFRRKHVEWLQDLVGSKPLLKPNNKPVKIAFTNSEWYEKGLRSTDKKLPASKLWNVNDLQTVYIPTREQLRYYPSISQFADAKIIVVNASGWSKEQKAQLGHDPDYSYLCNLLVTEEVDKQNMAKTILLDNRDGGFDHCLNLLSKLSLEGRRIGNYSFKVATTDEELERFTREAKDIFQRSATTYYHDITIDEKNKVVEKINAEGQLEKWDPNNIDAEGNIRHKWRSIPDDGIPTMLVCGGHSNNNPKDLQEAKDYGYHCAKNGWRIVTGGGVLEGSMGATHTGFVQYYLDKMQSEFPENANEYQTLSVETQNALVACKDGGKISAEKLIKKHRNAIEELAEKGFINRDMFWSYTTEALAKLEGDGELAAGTTSFFAPNRVIRIDELIKPDTKIIMPGSFGTDEEFEAILEDHYKKRAERKTGGESPDSANPLEQPQTLIIYNPDGRYNSLLRHHNIDTGGDRSAAQVGGIIIVSTMAELAKVTNERQNKWTTRVVASKNIRGQEVA